MPCCCGVPPFVIQRDVAPGAGGGDVGSVDGLRLGRGVAKTKDINGLLGRRCISLHALRHGTAVFVEVPDDADAGVEDHRAQLRHAVRIYEVPVPIFRKFARHVGTPKCGCLLVSNAGHSGCAVLSDVLHSSSVTMLQAPPLLTHAAATLCGADVRGTELGAWLQEDPAEVARMALEVLLKDFQAEDFVAVVLQSQALPIVPLIQSAIPEVRHLYLYRDPLPTISSFASFAEASLPRWLTSLATRRWGRRLVFGWLMPMALNDNGFSLLGMVDEQVAFCRSHRTEFFARENYATHAVLWAANVRRARQILRNQDLASTASLKYEVLLEKPDEVCAALLRFCGLPAGEAEVEAAAAAARWEESKEETLSTLDRMKARSLDIEFPTAERVPAVVFSEGELALFDEILAYFDIPTQFKGSLSLPGDLLEFEARPVSRGSADRKPPAGRESSRRRGTGRRESKAGCGLQ